MHKYVNYITVILAFTAPLVALAEPAVTTSTNDPMVMKIYPDGTKIVVRWSEIGKAVDNGENMAVLPVLSPTIQGKMGSSRSANLPQPATLHQWCHNPLHHLFQAQVL